MNDESIEELLASLPDFDLRRRLNEEFLGSIPSSEPALRQAVIRGVWRCIDVPHPAPSRIKSKYGILSAGEARALWDRWTMDPTSFERDRPASVIDAVREYGKDREADEQMSQRAWRQAFDGQLPTPPPGYHWEMDYGGLRHPGLHHESYPFRLWHRDLGYMLHSE